MLFEINNLKKVLGGRQVLDVPELCLEKGIIYGLLGPNGAGKTTLLQILSFLLEPTAGRMVYDSKEVEFSKGYLQKLRREVVMVHQNPILFTTSVRKNIGYGLKVRRASRGERERVIDEMLDLVGMREFARAPADRLSGGETQKVAIARALACSPRVILFDEPTASVDAPSRIAVENIIRDINAEKGISIIFTTHDMIQSSRLASDQVFLFDGRPGHDSGEAGFDALVKGDDNSRP